MIARFALALALFSLPLVAAAQQFGKAQFQIKADDGDLMANHALTAAQMAEVAKLPGLVNVGDPNGDVALYQFYDLNCPFCHTQDSYDLRWMVRKKKDRIPQGGDERDRAKFAKAQSYMVLLDDKVACKNLRCRKRFDISGVKTMAFI